MHHHRYSHLTHLCTRSAGWAGPPRTASASATPGAGDDASARGPPATAMAHVDAAAAAEDGPTATAVATPLSDDLPAVAAGPACRGGRKRGVEEDVGGVPAREEPAVATGASKRIKQVGSHGPRPGFWPAPRVLARESWFTTRYWPGPHSGVNFPGACRGEY